MGQELLCVRNAITFVAVEANITKVKLKISRFNSCACDVCCDRLAVPSIKRKDIDALSLLFVILSLNSCCVLSLKMYNRNERAQKGFQLFCLNLRLSEILTVD